MSAKFFQFKKNLFLAILLLVIFVLPNNALAENLLTVGSANSNLTGTDSAIFSNIGSISATTTSLIRLQKNGVDLFKVDSTGNVTMGNFLTSISAANVSNGIFGSLSGGGNYSFPASVGIGVSVPVYPLHISSSGADTGLLLQNNTTTLNNSASLRFLVSTSASPSNEGARLIFTRTDSPAAADGDLSFWTRGSGVPTERMRITSNGNVGIGITNPSSKLHVIGDIRTPNNSKWDFWNSGPISDGYIQGGGNGFVFNSYSATNGFNFTKGSSATSLMFINSSGNVGIGNPSPGYKLDVNGEANFGIGTTTNRLHNVSAPTYGTDAANKNYVDSVIAPAATTTVGLQSGFWTTGANSSIFNNNTGNVGIGTNNPASNLTVLGTGTEASPTTIAINAPNATSAGDARLVLSQTTGVGDFLLLYTGTDSRTDGRVANEAYIEQGQSINIRARNNGSTFSSNILIGQNVVTFGTNARNSNASERMRIDSTGNVGIGTTTPQVALDVNGLIKMRASNITTTSDVINKGYLDSALETLSSSTNALNYWAANGTNIYNKNTGNVGIGTTAPQAKLHVLGDVMVQGLLPTGGNNLIRNADLSYGDYTYWVGAWSYPGYAYTRTLTSDATAPVRSRNKSVFTITAVGGSGDAAADTFNITDLELNTDYNMSCYIRTTSAVQGYFNVEKYYKDWTGRVDDNLTLSYLNNGNWQRVSGYFNTTDKPNANINIRGFTSTGTWDITGCQLTKGRQLNTFSLNPSDTIYVQDSRTFGTTYGLFPKIINTYGTVANSYGVYIPSPSGAIVNKYALVTEVGAGNVGIGTTTPSTLLDLAGNLKITSGGIVYNTNSGYRFNFSDIFGDNNSLKVQGDLNSAGVLETTGTTRPNYVMGDLGIGTTNPTSRLQIASGGGISFAGRYKTYETVYNVNTATPAVLVDDTGAALNVNKSYRVKAYIPNTGTETGAVAIFRGNGTTFTLLKNFEAGLFSNHVELYLDANVPKIRLYNHTSLYQVSVLTEEVSNKSWAFGSEVNLYSNPSGYVGIGTDAPTKKLDIAGDLLVRNAATFNSSITATSLSGTAGRILAVDASGTFYATSSSIATGLPSPSGISGYTLRSDGTSWVANNLLYNNGTNIGIGTAAPSQKLDVQGNIAIANNMIGGGKNYGNSGNSASAYLQLYDNSTGRTTLNNQGYAIDFQTATTSRLFITNGGNVGIGTTNPGYKLDVAANNNRIRALGTTGYTLLDLQNTGGSLYLGKDSSAGGQLVAGSAAYSGVINSQGSYPLHIATNGNIAMTILNGGNVGIGTTTPNQKLEVSGGNIFITDASINSGTPHAAITKTYLDSALETYGSKWILNGSKLYASSTDWNVGIGVTSPTRKLQIDTNGAGLYVAGAGESPYSQNIAEFYYKGNGNSLLIKQIQGQAGITTGGSSQNLYLSTNGANSQLTINATTGNVGIGTTNPIGKLFVGSHWRTSHGGTDLYIGSGAGITNTSNLGITYSASSSATAAPSTVGITLYNDDATAGGWSPLLLFSKAESGPTPYKATMAGIAAKTPTGIGSGDSWIDGELHFYTAGTGTNGLVDRMVINKDGSVGISSTTPSGLLAIGNYFSVSNLGTIYGPTTDRYLDLYGAQTNSIVVPKSILTSGGKLGVGTTAPGGKAEIAQGMSDYGTSFTEPHLKLKALNTVNNTGFVGITYDASTAPNYGWSSGSLRGASGDLSSFVWKYHNNSAAGTEYMRISQNGTVGINTTAPNATYKLDVAGKINTSGGDAGGFCLSGDCIDSWGDVVGTFNSSTPLTIGNLTVSNIVMDQTGGFGNILNVRKLTVGTIDPLYRIDGTNYSSFAAAIVGGVKEEYLGRVKISQAKGDEYEYRLDFSKLSAPDELWVWRQTVDFSPENVEVNLTPYGAFANIYYIIENEAIIFRADKPVTVSYRLSGKRVDWQNWPTTAKDQQEKPSFIINKGKVIK